MATYYQYYWPAQDLAAVCALQNTSGAGNLLLNGTYFDPTTTTISFSAQGFARQVSFTSVNDLSAAMFTISGVQNNTVVTDMLSGPNNNTVYTTDAFDIISSVSVNMAVTGIEVGLGLGGYFPIIGRVNPFAITIISNTINYSLGFATESSNGCTYQIYQSLNDLRGNGETYSTLIGENSFISVDGPYSNNTQILQFADVSNNVLVGVTSSIGASTLNMQFLQF